MNDRDDCSGLAARLAEAIDAGIHPAVWMDPGPLPGTIALALLDVAYAPGGSHRIVDGIQRRYRIWVWDTASQVRVDPATVSAVAALLAEPEKAQVRVDGRHVPVLTGNTLYGWPKRRRLEDAVDVLASAGVQTFDDLRAVAEDGSALEDLRSAWCARHGLGQAAFGHLLVLAGIAPFIVGGAVRRWLAGTMTTLGTSVVRVADLQAHGELVDTAIRSGAERLAAREDFRAAGLEVTGRGLTLTMGWLQTRAAAAARAG